MCLYRVFGLQLRPDRNLRPERVTIENRTRRSDLEMTGRNVFSRGLLLRQPWAEIGHGRYRGARCGLVKFESGLSTLHNLDGLQSNRNFGKIPKTVVQIGSLPNARYKLFLHHREQRYVDAQLTFHYDSKHIIREQTELSKGLAGRDVEIYDFSERPPGDWRTKPSTDTGQRRIRARGRDAAGQ
jgi:hypothetical protein